MTSQATTQSRSFHAMDDDVSHYARCIAASKRVRWTIDEVIQGRSFDPSHKFLPDGFARVEAFPQLSPKENRLIGQIQGRTYANMFGLLERYVNAKVLELSQDYWFGDQTKLEALIRFSDEEIKHQQLFRCIEESIASAMPDGYCFTPQPNPVAKMVLSRGTWAVLGLTLMVELVTQAHYRECIAPDDNLSPLYKDVFHYHWKEESQHATLDQLEWQSHDSIVGPGQRDTGVDELIDLAVAIDGILQDQAMADTEYFREAVGRPVSRGDAAAITNGFLTAYRWQYIFSGAENPRFVKVIGEMTTDAQMRRIEKALKSLN